MKKISIITCVAIIIIGVLIWKGPNQETVIKIGVVGPFTGSAASFGDLMQRGLDLGLASLTDEQKSRIQIIKEDDACSGKNAVSAVKKLIEVDKVNYIIGPLCNESTLATETLFEDNKVISVSIGLPSNKIAEMGPYHFSFSPEIEYLMKTLSQKVIDENMHRVAVIHITSAMEEENYSNFVKHFRELGGVIVADEAAPKGASDFRDLVLKVKQSKPDAIVIMAYREGELNTLLKQLSDAGLGNLPKFGIHAVQTPAVLNVKDLAEGLIYPYPADKTANESAAAYARMYREKYDADPDISSSNTYDSLRIFVTSIEKCGYSNKECVRDSIAQLKNYQGANGSLSLDERGVGTYKEIMLKVVHDGKFEKLPE
jgi:branched-chain amino acid transport system substrate-binding protein